MASLLPEALLLTANCGCLWLSVAVCGSLSGWRLPLPGAARGVARQGRAPDIFTESGVFYVFSVFLKVTFFTFFCRK